jgi:hypothetical protein
MFLLVFCVCRSFAFLFLRVSLVVVECGVRRFSFISISFLSSDQKKENPNNELSNSRWKSGSAVLQGSVVAFIERNRLTETTSIELEMSKCEECIWISYGILLLLLFFFVLFVCVLAFVSSICTN